MAVEGKQGRTQSLSSPMGSCYPRTHPASPKPSLRTLFAGGQEGNGTGGLLLAYAFFQRPIVDRYIGIHVYIETSFHTDV